MMSGWVSSIRQGLFNAYSGDLGSMPGLVNRNVRKGFSFLLFVQFAGPFNQLYPLPGARATLSIDADDKTHSVTVPLTDFAPDLGSVSGIQYVDGIYVRRAQSWVTGTLFWDFSKVAWPKFVVPVGGPQYPVVIDTSLDIVGFHWSEGVIWGLQMTPVNFFPIDPDGTPESSSLVIPTPAGNQVINGYLPAVPIPMRFRATQQPKPWPLLRVP